MVKQQQHVAASTCLSAAVCEGGKLCRPLSPQPTFENEVVAYHSDGIYGANGSEYALYDYSKVTAIADYSWLYANETICTAHLHGVRVLGFDPSKVKAQPDALDFVDSLQSVGATTSRRQAATEG